MPWEVIMDIKIRKIKPEETIAAEKLIMRTYNKLRKDNGMELIPYKPSRKKNPGLCHRMNTDPKGTYGAFKNGKMVGFSQAFIRDGHWYLAELFVDSRLQCKGLGRKLLKKSLSITKDEDVHTHSLATFSYNPTAIALYSSFGFHPIRLLPRMQWAKDKKKKKRKMKTGYDFKSVAIESYKQIEILNKLDKRSRGIYRPEEHKYWIDSEDITGQIFYLGRKVVGYSYSWKDIFIVPVCARSSEYLLPLLKETINILRSRDSEKISLWISGTNGNIMEFLLKDGFKIEENEVLMSDRMFYKEDSYIPAPLDIF
jgi:ribosomal protein S18 acetylase RimI-like enzyme